MECTKESILRWFKAFKLNNSIVTVRHCVSAQLTEDRDQILKHHLYAKLVNAMFQAGKVNITRVTEQDFSDKDLGKRHDAGLRDSHCIEYEARVLVLRPDELKTIVEGCIVLMTDEQIQKVKSGSSSIDDLIETK